MSASSAKGLFRAIRPKRTGDPLFDDLPSDPKPAVRDALDFDPTPPDATEALLAVEGDRIRNVGQNHVWEPAVGAGHIADVLMAHHLLVAGNDIKDRGWPGTITRSYYDFDTALAPAIVTNPPYNEINARDGHGRWLRHTMGLKDVRYCAMLLHWDWPAARQNGMDELHRLFPFARVYLCCWKIDFRGGGSPPQRNAWFIWDREWQGEPVFRRLFRDVPDSRQGVLAV